MNKIGILYICTGKYDIFWKDFYLSAEEFFLKNSEIHYFVFTDAEKLFDEENNPRIHKIYQESLGWPDNTLRRFEIFLKAENEVKEMDYIYFFNANLKVQEPVTESEFLPGEGENFVATIHPGFYNKPRRKFTYDTNKESTACINKDEGIYYFQGALEGGRTKDFLEASRIMSQNVQTDAEKGVMAIWHDESHWNRYMAGRDDIHILDPSYIFPEGWKLPFVKKILMRDKSKVLNMGAIRGNKIKGMADKIFTFLKGYLSR